MTTRRAVLSLVAEFEPITDPPPEQLEASDAVAHEGHEVYPVEYTYLLECWDCGCLLFLPRI